MEVEHIDDKVHIELSMKEAHGILMSLARTMCNGDNLTISMELEDEIQKIFIEEFRKLNNK